MTNKFKLHVQDQSFAHTPVCVAPERVPKYFEWDRSLPGKDDWCVYTNFNARNMPHNPERSIAWLYESPELLTDLRVNITMLAQNFKYIITNDATLKETHNLRYFNTHATFIDTSFNGYYTPGTPKTKLCSLICSDKRLSSGHHFRLGLAKFLQQSIPDIDCFGGAFNHQLPKKVDALAEYAYTIVIENGIHDGYFTEKLSDSIYCETVPIYFGDGRKARASYAIDGFEWLKNLKFDNEIYRQKYQSVKLARNSTFLDAPEDKLYTDILAEIL